MAGLDGCRGGWLRAIWEVGTGRLEMAVLADWAAVEADLARRAVDLAGVDMPIGLADEGPRACDLAARARLPAARKSSVFPPPRRYMLGCRDWREAHDLGRRREGKGLSIYAWNITDKIRDIDRRLTPDGQERVIEVHPELAFHRLNGDVPVARKKSAEGCVERLALLEAAGLPDLAPWLDRFPRRLAKPDDVIDAAACALVARRALLGAALRLPQGEATARDSRGLRMEIWC